MEWSFLFFLNSALLGVGLAMDAFSVSMANGLHDPGMSRKRMCIIAGTFGVFQAVMPMTGWVCVHTIVEMFSSFETFIPWIALALLGYIGGKMLIDGIRGEETEEAAALSAGALFMQGVATSIDALSVGCQSLGRLYHCGVWLADGAGSFRHHCRRHLLPLHGGPAHRQKVRHKALRQGLCAGRCHPHRHWAGNFHLRRVLLKKGQRKPAQRQAGAVPVLFPVEHF